VHEFVVCENNDAWGGWTKSRALAALASIALSRRWSAISQWSRSPPVRGWKIVDAISDYIVVARSSWRVWAPIAAGIA